MYQNADERARFFSSINPYWDEGLWKNLLYQYVQMINFIAVFLASGDYRQSLLIFDRISYLTALIADYLSRGIIANIAAHPPGTPTPAH